MFGFSEKTPERTVGPPEDTSDSSEPAFASEETRDISRKTSEFTKETPASEDATRYAVTCGHSSSQEEAKKVPTTRSSSNPLDFLNPFLPAPSEPSTSVSFKFPTVSLLEHSQSSTEDYDSSPESRSEDSVSDSKKTYQMDSLYSVISATQGPANEERHIRGQDARYNFETSASHSRSEEDGTCTTLHAADNDLKNGRRVERILTTPEQISVEESKPSRTLQRNDEISVVKSTPTRTDYHSEKACVVFQEPHVVDLENSQDSTTDKEGSGISETHSTASTIVSSNGDDGESSDYDDNTRTSHRPSYINVNVVVSCESADSGPCSFNEATDTVPTVKIVADDVDANGLLTTTATDFTTLPQSPILTLAPPFTSADHSTASDTTTATTCTASAVKYTASPSSTVASPGSARKVLVTSLPRHGQTNSISHLLNKWHAIETEAATTAVSSVHPPQRSGRFSGLHSTRRLSKSTSNLDGVGSGHAEVFHRTALVCAVSSEEELDDTQDGRSIASTILSRDTMPLIYGSTGDLRTSPRRPENERVKVPLPQPLSASAGGDKYKMSFPDNLNIVIITSDDVTSGTGPDQRVPSLSDRTSSISSLPSSAVTSPRHDPSCSSDAKTTVAGLPSVHSLIAKFNPHGNDLQTTSAAAKFASSRQRWSSTPRLQGPASTLSSSWLSSSQTSLSGKNLGPPVQSSARYQWSPSTSSWVLSSSPERRRPVSSYELPQV